MVFEILFLLLQCQQHLQVKSWVTMSASSHTLQIFIAGECSGDIYIHIYISSDFICFDYVMVFVFTNCFLGYVDSGEFVVVNKHLLNDLTDMGLWGLELKNKIIHYNGSIQKIPEIPDDLKAVYKYIFAINLKILNPNLNTLDLKSSYQTGFVLSGLCGRLSKGR